MGRLGVARANTAVDVSPEVFLLLLLLLQIHAERVYVIIIIIASP
jgi:hypothetical protein